MSPSPMTLTPGRRALLVALFVAAILWLAGPPGRLLVAMALLVVAPGYLLERLLPGARPHLLARFALWVALGLSLTPLLYQWLWVVGLPLADGPLWALLTLLVALLSLAAWRDLAPRAVSAPATAWLLWAALGLITALTLWTRFEQIRALALPPWVDSVHHALLVRVAVERQAAPLDLAPYLPLVNLPYHWGYHVIAATLMRLSGLALPETLLWSGQILNALHAPLAGALALVLWRRPAAAVGAAIVVGLVSLMPAYYLSWGRYTQLTGLLLIPGLVAAWDRALHEGPATRWQFATAGLIVAGLSLIHVRVLAFALALLAAQTLVWAVARPWPALRTRLLPALAAVALALALSAPWSATLLRQALLPAVANPGSLVLEGDYDALNLAILWVGLNQLLAALALLGLLLGLHQRHPAAAIVPLWVVGLLILANPRLLGYLLPLAAAALLVQGLLGRAPLRVVVGLAAVAASPLLARTPSSWLINNDAVVISLFLPLAVAIGGGTALALERARSARHASVRSTALPVALALALATSLWGAWQLRDVVNESTVLATSADRVAVEWAAANTPPDARFLINAAPWLGVAGRATDGGWWLLPLAGRWVSTPPVIFTFGPTAYVTEVAAITRAVEAYQPGGEQAILDLIRRERITHLYFGVKPGPMRAETFAALPGFTTVYNQGGVTILAVTIPS